MNRVRAHQGLNRGELILALLLHAPGRLAVCHPPTETPVLFGCDLMGLAILPNDCWRWGLASASTRPWLASLKSALKALRWPTIVSKIGFTGDLPAAAGVDSS